MKRNKAVGASEVDRFTEMINDIYFGGDIPYKINYSSLFIINQKKKKKEARHKQMCQSA